MSVDRDELEEQLVEIFERVEFPVSSRPEVERYLDPADANKRIESGEFSMTLRAIGRAVRGGVGDYPYEDAESLAAAVLDALEDANRL